MKNIGFVLYTLFSIILLIGENTIHAQYDGSDKEYGKVKIIFDTDMGSDCDDAGALALLHSYVDEGKAEIAGCIYSSGRVPYGAGIIDAINTLYGREDLPVGASYDTLFGDPADKMTAEKLAKDTACFHNNIIHNYDALEQTLMNRKILSASEDYSIVYVTLGHTKGLYDLYHSSPDSISSLKGRDLIKQKVKKWVALGALRANNEARYYTKDWNFFFNGSAPYTKFLIENFPVPIYYVDAGSGIMTGKSLENNPPGNIVRTVYRDWLWNVQQKTIRDQRPSWDLVTIYFAVEGTGGFLKNMGRGSLEMDIEEGCRWNHQKNHVKQFFIQEKSNIEKPFSEYLNKRISERTR